MINGLAYTDYSPCHSVIMVAEMAKAWNVRGAYTVNPNVYDMINYDPMILMTP